jgi:hypothetical protein
MTCEESMTLDLAEFLVRPTAPEFAAFRAHYPRCVECAAEVSAWTELHASLSEATHPSPDMLLRYEDGRLTDADRNRIARHLAGCAPCRDELRALAVFDDDAAPVAARAAKPPRLSFRLPRLVLHPALAYGLVLALLFYPALRSRVSETEITQEPARSADRALEAKLEDRPVAALREERAALAKKAAPAQPAAEPPAAAGALARSDTSERELDAAARDRLRSLAYGTGAASPRAEVEIVPGPSAEETTLRIPVRRESGELEVHIVDERSRRELRERVTAMADRAEVKVPRVWLVPGRYRVEVRDARGSAAPDVFTLAVEK